jgi:hypothetical protein
MCTLVKKGKNVHNSRKGGNAHTGKMWEVCKLLKRGGGGMRTLVKKGEIRTLIKRGKCAHS